MSVEIQSPKWDYRCCAFSFVLVESGRPGNCSCDLNPFERVAPEAIEQLLMKIFFWEKLHVYSAQGFLSRLRPSTVWEVSWQEFPVKRIVWRFEFAQLFDWRWHFNVCTAESSLKTGVRSNPVLHVKHIAAVKAWHTNVIAYLVCVRKVLVVIVIALFGTHVIFEVVSILYYRN